MISAVILTKNEEENIKRCIFSLLWCDEIIIIDDYSEDKTIKKVKSQSASWRTKAKSLKIFRRRLDSDFSSQRNFGLLKATGDWVLFIDADEVISKALASEIKSQISNLKSQSHSLKSKAERINGFYIRRKDYFLGRWLKYGETANIKLLRLAKKNAGRWKGRVHEVWKIKGKVGELENPLLHYPHPSVFQFLKEINWYTDIVAQCWKEERRKVSSWEILSYPVGKFIQNYIFRAGFLDGVSGLILAIFMSFHSFLVRGKLWMKVHRGGYKALLNKDAKLLLN